MPAPPKTYDLRAFAILGALALLWVLFYFATDGAFLSARNLSNLARQSCITGLLATGMVLVVVSGNIDLSVGSLLGLTGGMAAIMSVWWGMPLPVVILATLMLGALLGLLNGWLTASVGIPSFIVTLGGLLMYRGMIKGATAGSTVGPVPDLFKAIGQQYLPVWLSWVLAAFVLLAIWSNVRHRSAASAPPWRRWFLPAVYSAAVITFVSVMNNYEGIPIPVVILFAFAFIFHFITIRTIFGRRVYAIGGNPDAAHLSGINIKRNTIAVFVLMGLLSAVAGLVYTARVASATADAGRLLELDAIAACVIGGTSLMGGRGTVGGALIGALIMASLDNGMSLMNVQDFFQDITKGAILLLAVGIDVLSKRGK